MSSGTAARERREPPSILPASFQPSSSPSSKGKGWAQGRHHSNGFHFLLHAVPPLLLQEGQCSNETQEQLVLLKRTHGPFTETAPRQNKSEPPRLHMSILRLRITCEHENPSSQMLSRDKNSFPGKKFI